MGFYNDVILPRLCDLAMRNKDLLPYRARAIRAARAGCSRSASGLGAISPSMGPP